MKPAPFDYVAATSIDDVLGSLKSGGGEAKILAGGQSLVPAMNFRLSRPSLLVDINGVADLQGIEARADGGLSIGALVRHVELENNNLGGTTGAILAEMGKWVGHAPVRMRGTIGGSLAHADPAAEWGVMAVTLDASIDVIGPEGPRRIGASDFFRSVFATDLRPDEVVTRIDLPPGGPNAHFAFREFSRRAGDFALVAVLAVVEVASDGSIQNARIGLGGVGAIPLRAPEAEALLIGSASRDDALLRAAADAAAEGTDPPADIHATTLFRKKLVRNLTFDALKRAGSVV